MKEKNIEFRRQPKCKKVKDSYNSRYNINCISGYNCSFTYSSRHYNHVCYVR